MCITELVWYAGKFFFCNKSVCKRLIHKTSVMCALFAIMRQSVYNK